MFSFQEKIKSAFDLDIKVSLNKEMIVDKNKDLNQTFERKNIKQHYDIGSIDFVNYTENDRNSILLASHEEFPKNFMPKPFFQKQGNWFRLKSAKGIELYYNIF